MTNGALDGLRVLDLSRVLAGPFCCMMLGDHGADVIKVEPPGGDETRTWGPPFVDGESPYYLNANRNKRGIVLDLSTPEGQEIARRLAQTSDILVENFKTGTTKRWGLDYPTLRAHNPRLIYCSISGFGRTGPYADVAGYDAAIQAMGGFMSINGEAGGQPLKAGIAIADLSTAIYASQAILLALYRRTVTGEGQQVEVSLFESMLSLVHPHTSNFLNADVVGKPHGNSHPMLSPYDLLPTQDRPVYLPSGNDGQIRRLAGVLGRPDIAEDPRFRTNELRVAHRAELLTLLAEEFKKRPAAEWCRLLWDVAVPVGPVNTLREVFDDPQAHAREVIWEIDHQGLSAGVVRTVKPAVTLHESPATPRRSPPRPGEHTIEVLTELHWSAQEIDDLLQRNVACQAPPIDV